ncbi:MAG: hypothetical protein M3332_00855 [Actinomycetota bacterium]|nr:hypothetical protein [Actinomycetota bacterium]
MHGLDTGGFEELPNECAAFGPVVVKAPAAPTLAWLAVLCLRLPGGPAPLAARGLPAVLARAGPAGGGGRCV